jgi:TPR repeat protein
MRARLAIGVLSLTLAAPCLAGALEDGSRLYDQKRYAQAITAFRKAAVAGNSEAQRRLGFMYYHGEGVAQDNKRAVALFETSANAGDIMSASNLGMMYEHGMGVDQNDALAASWYRKAAELGDSRAQFTTSIMYYRGQGVPQDRIEAAKWWTLAMMQGGAVGDMVRRSVESAQSKLTPEQNAEGERRANEWLASRSVHTGR